MLGDHRIAGGSRAAAAISAATVVADDRCVDASGTGGSWTHGACADDRWTDASRPARFLDGCLPDRRFPNGPVVSGIERLQGRYLPALGSRVHHQAVATLLE